MTDGDDGECCCCRHAYPGNAAARHAADARQHSHAVLLHILDLRHHRRPDVEGTAATALLRTRRQRLHCQVGVSADAGREFSSGGVTNNKHAIAVGDTMAIPDMLLFHENFEMFAMQRER